MTHLDQLMRSLIYYQGPICISVFMRMVVKYYYEGRDSIGADGDFITAPEVSQLFGEMIGAWCVAKMFEAPEQKWTLVEVGPGRGTLMFDVLHTISQFSGAVELIEGIVLIEQSVHLQEQQKKKLESLQGGRYGLLPISWSGCLEDIPCKNVIVLGNEFLDALAITQYQMLNGQFHKVRLGLVDNCFSYVLEQEVSSIDRQYHNCPEGGIVEISEEAIEFVRRISRIQNMHALLIDYGYRESNYQSTLQAVRDHSYHDVLLELGSADVTALVDFGALLGVAIKSGLEAHLITQKEFLLSCGIMQRADGLISRGADKDRISAEVARLTEDSAMGELFKCLILSTGKVQM